MTPIMEIDKVTKSVDDFKLGPLSINIEQGFVTAIVGNNGAGKSTLLKIINSLVKPTEGQIRILGKNINDSEAWKKEVSYLPQNKIGYDPFTGKELKDLNAHFYPNWSNSLFYRMVERLDVRLDKKFKQMSPGMQQKLMLSITVSRNASIMILDEPTSHMDIASKQALMEFLIEWMEEDHRSLIMASHQAEDIRKLADYILVLKDGELLDFRDKESFTERYTRYWLHELPDQLLPGEVNRQGTKQVITENEHELEQFLKQQHIQWFDKEHLELEDTISMMLTHK